MRLRNHRLCEIGKLLREIRKSLYGVRQSKIYKSLLGIKGLTVDNEKSLCEEKKSPFEIIDWLFSEPVSILAGLW